MSQLDPMILSQSNHTYRHQRRRWVPKGVLLLLILLVLGLSTACSGNHIGAAKAIYAGSIVDPGTLKTTEPTSAQLFELSAVVGAVLIRSEQSFHTDSVTIKSQF